MSQFETFQFKEHATDSKKPSLGSLAKEASHLPPLLRAEPKKKAPNPVAVISSGGIIAALFASLCCIGPLIFGALGVGVGATGLLASTAGFLKGLVPYRPLFIVIALAAIGTGFFLVYRKPQAACVSDSSCSGPHSHNASLWFLGIATVLTLLFVLSPYWVGLFR